MTITFKKNDVEIIFKNVDDFNKFWYYDSGNVSMRSANGLLEFNNGSVTMHTGFERQDGYFHRPQSETVNGETWYVNDGKQPVKDDVKVDVMFKSGKKTTGKSGFWYWIKDKGGETWRIPHWRLAK